MKACAVVFALACFAATAAQAAGAEPQYLCQGKETLVFGCLSGKKMISVCASPGYTADTGYVQYRFGVPGKVELAYPATLQPARGKFWFSNTGYSGGGEAHLRFVNEGVVYAVFDRMVRTNFKPGEPNNPDMSEGVVVKQPGKKAVKRLCTASEGGVRSTAYDSIEREEFDYDLVP